MRRGRRTSKIALDEHEILRAPKIDNGSGEPVEGLLVRARLGILVGINDLSLRREDVTVHRLIPGADMHDSLPFPLRTWKKEIIVIGLIIDAARRLAGTHPRRDNWRS
jgi:hypothetical protein